MRSNLAFCIGLLAGMSSVVSAQQESKPSPVISLRLPPDIASETVQINYFMFGSFGGYGEYVKTEKGRASYDIVASVDGKPAEAVKIIAYMPGCEITKIEVKVQDSFEARTLSCKPQGTVPLYGKLISVPAIEKGGVEIEISYSAYWGHEFFHITDGAVTTIRIGSAIPDDAGEFRVELPDFFQQTNLGKGSFRFLLRNHANLNIIATLKPENMPRIFGELAVRDSYVPFVSFSIEAPKSASVSTDPGMIEGHQNRAK